VNGNATVSSIVEDGLVYMSGLNSMAKEIANATLHDVKGRMPLARPEWTGIGVGWLRSLLGRREWRIPCVDVYVRL
jgi:hypothetical protein